jgi:L-ribulokinase
VCGVVPGSVHPQFTGIEAGLSATGDIFEAIARRAGVKVAESFAKARRLSRRRRPACCVLSWDNGDRTVLVNAELGGVTFGWNLLHHRARTSCLRRLKEPPSTPASSWSAWRSTVCPSTASSMPAEFRRIMPLLNQVYANVLNKPVLVPAGVPTSLGSGIFALVAAGAFATIEEAQASLCLDHKTFVPDPHAAAVYEQLYRLYRKAYFALGSRSAAAASLGDILPTLRKIAAEVVAAG